MIIIVNKPSGMTSQQVVSKIKHAFNYKIKIGHTGTLDPMCTGVLPVLTDNDTKLSDLFESDKEYIAGIKLGLVTDTQDITGNIIKKNNVAVSENDFRECLLSFKGDIMQIPPMYSAIKVNGQKLYDLARQGIEIKRDARHVSIYKIDCIDRIQADSFTMRVSCSKGTYIRTLCHDIGEKLGCGAVMSSLERTKSNGFDIMQSNTLEYVTEMIKQGNIEKIALQSEDVLKYKPYAVIPPEAKKYYLNGGVIDYSRLSNISFIPNSTVRAYDSTGVFLGLAILLQDGIKNIWLYKK